MDDWMVELRNGNSDAAWDLFIVRYRRVIFAAIHHYARDPDDVMDIFAWVSEALRENDLHRLRQYSARPSGARVSTWLVTVVRRLTVDWLRRRDGRHSLPVTAEGLSPLRRRIFELVYVARHPRAEAYEVIRASDAPDLSFSQFLTELRATHQAVYGGRPGLVAPPLVAPLADAPTVQAPKTGETAERRAVLADAVQSLKTGERRAVDLYVIEERPASTIAAMLGLPNAKAVYNRVYRALNALRERLEKGGIRRGDL